MSRISFAEIPDPLMKTMLDTETYIESLNMDLRLIELMRLIASQINQCNYCIEMHNKIALDNGESKSRLKVLNEWRGENVFSPLEKVCFAWAEYITQPLKVDNVEKLFHEMHYFFNMQEIANLTLVMTQINSWNRLMKAFDIEG